MTDFDTLSLVDDSSSASSSEDEAQRLQDLEIFVKHGSHPKGQNNTEEESNSGLQALEHLAITDSSSESSGDPSNGGHNVSNYSEEQSLHRCPSDIHDTTLAMDAVPEWQPPSRYEVLEAASKFFLSPSFLRFQEQSILFQKNIYHIQLYGNQLSVFLTLFLQEHGLIFLSLTSIFCPNGTPSTLEALFDTSIPRLPMDGIWTLLQSR